MACQFPTIESSTSKRYQLRLRPHRYSIYSRSDHGRNVGNTGTTSFHPLIGIRPTADPLNWYSKRISSLPMAEPSVSVGRPEEKEINHRMYGGRPQSAISSHEQSSEAGSRLDWLIIRSVFFTKYRPRSISPHSRSSLKSWRCFLAEI